MKKHLFAILFGASLSAFTAFSLCSTFLIKVNQGSHAITALSSSVPLASSSFGVSSSASSQGSSPSEGSALPAASSAEESSSSSSSSMEPIYTDSSYEDSSIAIHLTEDTAYSSQIYVADVVIKDLGLLKAALAEDTYGMNYKETTSSIAKKHNAILAINGDFYGYSNRSKGYMIRNGVLYDPDRPAWDTCLSIQNDGSFAFYDETKTTSTAILYGGSWQCFSFGPVLVKDGTAIKSSSTSSSFTSTNPRTAIGMVEPLHYKMVVCDGRTSASAGLNINNLAAYMQSIGCADAYNLDGAAPRRWCSATKSSTSPRRMGSLSAKGRCRTLSTSDIKALSKKTSIAFAIGVAANLLFILIYYLVDHELRSQYMSWSFLPLVLGALLYALNLKILIHGKWSYSLVNAGLVTMAVGMYYHGIVDMADAGGFYQYIFYAVGTGLFLAGMILALIHLIRRESAHE